ncbi:MAG: MarR family transcriptional regulator [Actinobacteria bacterium]|nr:MarR family transcriptional regulator [Actinomycetota bacterium]
MDTTPRWLNDSEQRAWRAWIASSQLLLDRLSRDIHAQHGLTMADYEILVRLSESADHRVRMSDLADRTLASRSRLSHQIDRMEKRGFVLREQCTDDKRGQFAVLTETGWQTLVAAAPDHVESVRTHLVDVLSPAEFAALGVACEKILGGLHD